MVAQEMERRRWKKGEEKMKAEELYKADEDFRRYVVAYAKKHNITVETAMTHKIVKNVADQYKAKAEVRG